MKKLFILLTILCMLTALICGCGDATDETCGIDSGEGLESTVASDESVSSEDISEEVSEDASAQDASEDVSDSSGVVSDEESDENTETSNNDEMSDYDNPPTIENSISEILLLNQTNNISLFSISSADQMIEGEYVDKSAPKTKTVELFGKEYELVYDHTAEYFLKGITAHTYILPDADPYDFIFGIVRFDTESWRIVEVTGFPYEGEIPKSEDNGYALTQRLVKEAGWDTDWENYQKRCETYYIQKSENGSGSDLLNEYKTMQENEDLIHYGFYFNKSIHGIATPESVECLFNVEYGTITFSIFDFEEGYFDKAIENIDYYTNNLDDIILKQTKPYVNEKYTITDITKGSFRLCVYHDEIYIRSAHTITYKTAEEKEYRSVFEFLTKIK